MPTNKDKLSLNIFIRIYSYRIYPINAIIISVILRSSFPTGAKLLCKLSPTTSFFVHFCLWMKNFFTVGYMFMPHRRGNFVGQELREVVFKVVVQSEALPVTTKELQ